MGLFCCWFSRRFRHANAVSGCMDIADANDWQLWRPVPDFATLGGSLFNLLMRQVGRLSKQSVTWAKASQLLFLVSLKWIYSESHWNIRHWSPKAEKIVTMLWRRDADFCWGFNCVTPGHVSVSFRFIKIADSLHALNVFGIGFHCSLWLLQLDFSQLIAGFSKACLRRISVCIALVFAVDLADSRKYSLFAASRFWRMFLSLSLLDKLMHSLDRLALAKAQSFASCFVFMTFNQELSK